MSTSDAIDKAIENATQKIAEADTPEEASQWQGIVNQQLAAKKELENYSEPVAPAKLNLDDKNK